MSNFIVCKKEWRGLGAFISETTWTDTLVFRMGSFYIMMERIDRAEVKMQDDNMPDFGI